MTPLPRNSSSKVQSPRDSAGALRRARRNADRRTSGATHDSWVCFAQLPHCPERQPAKSGLGTVLPRVVLIAGRPTLQTLRSSPGVYRNLEPSIARSSFLALYEKYLPVLEVPGWCMDTPFFLCRCPRAHIPFVGVQHELECCHAQALGEIVRHHTHDD
jgi:hypothetical protein